MWGTQRCTLSIHALTAATAHIQMSCLHALASQMLPHAGTQDIKISSLPGCYSTALLVQVLNRAAVLAHAGGVATQHVRKQVCEMNGHDKQRPHRKVFTQRKWHHRTRSDQGTYRPLLQRSCALTSTRRHSAVTWWQLSLIRAASSSLHSRMA